MVHAFVNEYACGSCGTAANNPATERGHNRAWYRLASAVKRVGARILGRGDLDLGRLTTMKGYWKPLGMTWPSLHDIVRDKCAHHPSVVHDVKSYGFLPVPDKADKQASRQQALQSI
jgi:hypothetical protein